MFDKTYFDTEDGSKSDTKTRVPKVGVEITKTLECDEMFARYVISLRKFKLEEQVWFAAKVNTMRIHRLQNALNVIMINVENTELNQYVIKE